MALGIQSDLETRRRTTAPRRASLVDVARTAVEDLVDLLGSQLKLARVELAADARGALRRITRLAVFVPPLVVGYAFGMAAAASWLASLWGMSLALAALAAVQIAIGAIGMVVVLRGFKRFELLSRTSAEGSATVALATTTMPAAAGSHHV